MTGSITRNKASAGTILVLGSSNIDLIARIPRFHHPGETITGGNLTTVFGGKGANQAIASMRLGGKVTFLTKLGHDFHGENYRQYLVKSGFDPNSILIDKRHPTGIALIEVDPAGENRIIVSPGANGSFSKGDVRDLEALWRRAKVFVAQLEIPIAAVRLGLETAKRQGAITLLNPSPPIPLPTEILSLVDYLVPNQWEARLLTGMKMDRRDSIRKMAHTLLEMGARNVVITLGAEGLFFKNRDEEVRMGAFNVKAIDTTAAGDAFMGALACGLAENRPIREVLRYASGAGALAATRLGAQPSLPRRKELEVFLANRTPRLTVCGGK